MATGSSPSGASSICHILAGLAQRKKGGAWPRGGGVQLHAVQGRRCPPGWADRLSFLPSLPPLGGPGQGWAGCLFLLPLGGTAGEGRFPLLPASFGGRAVRFPPSLLPCFGGSPMLCRGRGRVLFQSCFSFLVSPCL